MLTRRPHLGAAYADDPHGTYIDAMRDARDIPARDVTPDEHAANLASLVAAAAAVREMGGAA